ncbi:MAG TPA: hypothetical protein DDY20_09145 [Desulfobulbaceae bacterium]|jgi:hypothetical protein|nr:hypothetical protein [Desulfobulbaceae bacterium]
MLKKRILRSLCAFSFAAAVFAGVAVPGNAWEQTDAWKIVDYETHNDNPSLVHGTYTDWTGLPKPWNIGEGWPYCYNFYGRYTSSWGGSQARHGVAVWRVQIPKTGWYDLRTNFKRTDNRTTAAKYYVYANVTIADIKNYTTGAPIVYKVVDQHGPNEEAGEWYYAQFGAICMKAGDVSVLVLDARETDRSSSADAAFWTYLGENYNSQTCAPDADGDGIPDSQDACPNEGDKGFGLDATGCPMSPPLAPTNYLLLQGKRK